MTYQEFDGLVCGFLDSLLEMGKEKGKEYANSDADRLANFKKLAAELGAIPEQILMVYVGKHWLSVCHHIKGLAAGEEQNLTEPIEGRIGDIIMYMLLLLGLLAERDASPEGDT